MADTGYQELKVAGAAIVEMVYALSDGVGLEDMAMAGTLVKSLMAVADDIQADADSALLLILAGAATHLASKRAG